MARETRRPGSDDRTLTPAIDTSCTEIGLALAEREGALDEDPASGLVLESVNAAVIRLKDAVWAVQRDRLRTAKAVRPST